MTAPVRIPPRPGNGDSTPVTKVQTVMVAPDEDGMRVDRFLTSRFPGLNFVRVQSMIRKGELRVDGGRIKANGRLEAGDRKSVV